MAMYGRIEEFDSLNEDWSRYAERLGHYFVANDMENDEKKRTVLFTVVGATTYKLLRSLVAPAKPGDKSYSGISFVRTFQPCSFAYRLQIQVSL